MTSPRSGAGTGGPQEPPGGVDAPGGDPLDRAALTAAFFARDSLDVAPDLLGCVLVHGPVAVRITEVEAYHGVGEDPGSHSYRGRTARNATMFGPPGRLYVYFTYGMHWMVNLVCGSEGQSRAVLLRAGEVVAGRDVVAARREGVAERDWTRGPARLAKALGIDGSLNGAAVVADAPVPTEAGVGEASSELGSLAAEDLLQAMDVLPPVAPVDPARVRRGGRIGISGPGGVAEDYPWRWWLDGEPTVSSYRPGKYPSRRGR